MTPSRELAASLTTRVLDRIEDDRAINSANIEEAILDGLVLRAARGEPSASASPDQNVIRAAKELITIAVNEPAMWVNLSPKLADGMEKLYRMLQQTGWRPGR